MTALDHKIEGWRWVLSEFARVREEARLEAERLLGPDRGE